MTQSGRERSRVQSLAVLFVSDLENTKEFYQTVCGCEVTEWWALRDDELKLGFKLVQAIDKRDIKPNLSCCDDYGYADDADSLHHFLKNGRQME